MLVVQETIVDKETELKRLRVEQRKNKNMRLKRRERDLLEDILNTLEADKMMALGVTTLTPYLVEIFSDRVLFRSVYNHQDFMYFYLNEDYKRLIKLIQVTSNKGKLSEQFQYVPYEKFGTTAK